MGAETKIEWAHDTFNAWWGCVRVSPACEHCYAEGLDKRTGGEHWGPEAPRRFFGEKHWNEPRRWNAKAAAEGVRRRVFCSSMADVFERHRDPGINTQMDAARSRLYRLIDETPWLDWLLLTKRAENIREMLPAEWLETPRPNVWLGTTVEDQRRAEERIPHLLGVPAAVRFLSMEPLLEEVDLEQWIERLDHCGSCGAENGPQKDDECPECGEEGTLISTWGHAQAERYRTRERYDLSSAAGRADVDGTSPRINWVIVGGESGPGARPMDPEWARSIRDQCVGAGVPFFFKQCGEWMDLGGLHRFPESRGPGFGEFDHKPFDIPTQTIRLGKKAAGRLLDGRTWDEVPEVARG